jgi:K+-sensing histidine kinase KdpD
MSFKDLLASLQFSVGTPQEEDMKLLADSEFVRKLIDSVPEALLILNADREAIFSNMRLLKFVGIKKYEDSVGKLPGELLNCRHALNQDEKGCGRTDACKYCGLFNSVGKSLKGKVAQEECRILTIDNDALDLKVWATPLELHNKNYTIITLLDISNEKRREMLEHVFFHDILNSAGGIFGLAKLLNETSDSVDPVKVSDMIYVSSEHLIEEIQSQRQLRNAEDGKLELNPTQIRALDLLEDVKKLYSSHEVAKGKTIAISLNAENLRLTTDAALVRRVIGNMTKNALEASDKGDVITLSCVLNSRDACFSVNNPGFIPEEVQKQLFNRSYSTKGNGRGIGTYSMKLFGEKYLGGRVGFKTSEWVGTTFFLELPVLK